MGSVVIVLFLFGANLRARWWTQDDPAVMRFLGTEDHLPIRAIVPTLALNTDLNPQSSWARFRPSYSSLRIAEAWALGKHPDRWYALHLAFFAFFMTAVWYTASQVVGFLPAAMLATYTVTFSFWSDIFARLGAGEAYATLGLGFTLFGLHAIFQGGRSAVGWLLLGLGVVVAAGSKENFMVLLAPSVIALGVCVRKRTANWVAYLSTFLSVLWCAWIASVVIVRLQNWGGDVYFSSVQPSDRVNVLWQGLTKTGIRPLYGLGILFLCLWFYFRNRNTAAANAACSAIIGTLLLIGLYLSQVVFYNGDWPRLEPFARRYNLPGMLCWPLALLIIVWYGRQIEALLPAGRKWRLGVRRGAILIGLPLAPIVRAGMILVSLLSMASHVDDGRVEREASQANARRTIRFTGEIERLARIAARNPDYPVLVQTNSGWDYEAVEGYARFARAYRVTNEMYLLWIPAEYESSPFLDFLSGELARYSREGWGDTYLPRTQLNVKGHKCILVVIAGNPQKTCQVEMNGRWRDF